MANLATSVTARMAQKYGVEPAKFYETLSKVAFRVREKNAPDRAPTPEEMMSLLIVAETYGLNPFIRQIFAFRSKSGTVVPVVSIDGWLSILNRQSDYDGLSVAFSDKMIKIGSRELPESCTVTINRKSMSKPIVVSEYMAECYGSSDIWTKWPHRMLRHKAIIQAVRIAFGVGGIYDEDEVSAMSEAPSAVMPAVAPAVAPAPQPQAEPARVVEVKEVPKLALDTPRLDVISQQLTEMMQRFPDEGRKKAEQWADHNLTDDAKDYVLSKLPADAVPAPQPQSPAKAPEAPAPKAVVKPAVAPQPAPRKAAPVVDEPDEPYVPDVGDIPF